MNLYRLVKHPVDMEKITDIVNAVCNDLVANIQPIQVIVFGSYVSGGFHQYSDLDFVILVEKEDIKKALKFASVLPAVSPNAGIHL